MCSRSLLTRLRAGVLEDLAYEEACGESMPEQFRYQRGIKRRLECQTAAVRRKTARERGGAVRELLQQRASLVDPGKLAARLSSGCSRHSTPHRCLDPFQDNWGVIVNWRVLWASLPAATRREHLLAACRRCLEEGESGDPQRNVSWRFLGLPCCREAFQMLTGVGSWSITRAREAVLAGKSSSSSRGELGRCAGILGNSRPSLYLDVRQWLEHYAATHAEASPMKWEYYLPAGRKVFYYHHYVYDRRSAQPACQVASLEVFLKCWRPRSRYRITEVRDAAAHRSVKQERGNKLEEEKQKQPERVRGPTCPGSPYAVPSLCSPNAGCASFSD